MSASGFSTKAPWWSEIRQRRSEGRSDNRVDKESEFRLGEALPPKGEPNNVKDDQLQKGLHRDTDSQSHYIFVDQLPETMHYRWLGQLFAQCGTIRNVYIPSKRFSFLLTRLRTKSIAPELSCPI
ncbi:hypothetical protein U1Q18_028737 [Sarracenia purpurea var. burkii]